MQQQIQELENDIVEINKKYKELLKNTQEGSFDYPALKSELDSVVNALDEKGKEFFLLRKGIQASSEMKWWDLIAKNIY